jgi:hypothetical protein
MLCNSSRILSEVIQTIESGTPSVQESTAVHGNMCKLRE